MATRYSAILTDIWGQYKAVLPWRSLAASLEVNGVGKATIELPRTFDPRQAGPYQFVDVWRGIEGRRMRFFARYILLGTPRETAEKGTRFFTLQAYGLLHILEGRVRDEVDSIDTDKADDLIKSAVLTCLSYEDAALTSSYRYRDITRYYTRWSVQNKRSAGPSTGVKGSPTSLLSFAKDTVKLAAAATTPVYLFFDIVATGNGGGFGMEFRTYRNQRGYDLTNGTQGADGVRDTNGLSGRVVTLSREAGDFISTQFETDYSKEANFVWGAMGTGAALTARSATQSVDVLRYPLGRRETYGGPDANTSELLRAGRPQKVFRVELRNNRAQMFGRDWGWGDKMYTRFETEGGASRNVETLVVRADGVSLAINERGEETVGVQLRVVQ